MNQLKVNQQHTIVSLFGQGWSKRRIARELDLDRATVRKYLAARTAKPPASQTGSSHADGSKSPAPQSQANAKTTLKVATQTHNDTVAQRYPEFSSVIDLLRGAVGNNTALGKQLTNIRKQAIRQPGRAASNVIDVNASVKKAA